MRSATFVVDTALLQELGERMIGRAYIALAELVKNAYDADATECHIKFSQDQIEIIDNGHGISTDEFFKHWMRIGTSHKREKRRSRILHRSMTGSKGLGRLSVQFLAAEMTLKSTSSEYPSSTLDVVIDWDSIQRGEDIESFNVHWDVRQDGTVYPGGSRAGTRIILSGLRSAWSAESFRALGNELSVLRSPFKRSNRKIIGRSGRDFHVEIEASHIERAIEEFDKWQDALLSSWKARIRGSLRDGKRTCEANVIVEFVAGYPKDVGERIFNETVRFPVREERVHRFAAVDSVQFEILVFKPEGRQLGDIRVGEMREYLRQFGNVSVYDGEFRLPYYGSLEDKTGQDWLNVAVDQGRRLTVSELLPNRLRGADRYLLDLPAPGRIFGTVDIDTNHEQELAERDTRSSGEVLLLQPGRDRLAPNRAFEQLRDLVRWSLDFYANRFRLRSLQAAERSPLRRRKTEALDRAVVVLEESRGEISDAAYERIKRELVVGHAAASSAEQVLDRRAVLLAPLATAGMVGLALNHELGREILLLEQTDARLRKLSEIHGLTELRRISSDFGEATRRLHALQGLFTPLLSDVDSDPTERLRVEPVVNHVVRTMRPLMLRVRFDTSKVSNDLRFPIGAFSEWSAVLQNALSNAWNAMLDVSSALIAIDGRQDRTTAWLRIQDTGVGMSVPLSESMVLFEPFERRLLIRDANRSVAMGGQGLGLSIVRMITRHRGARVRFVAPEEGFSTSFEISWDSP